MKLSTRTTLTFVALLVLALSSIAIGAVTTYRDTPNFANATPYQIDGTNVTTSAAELNYLDLTTLGTGAASKAVVLDAGDDYIWPTSGLLSYGGANITASGTELSYTDITTLGTQQASKAVTADASNVTTFAGTVIFGSTGTSLADSYADSFTFDIASISANTCTSATLTLTGAAVNDTVTIGPPAAGIGNATQQGRVSAANTVVVMTCNGTGSAVDPASGAYTIRVFDP